MEVNPIVDFLAPIPFTIGWIFIPFYGLYLIKLTKYHMLGKLLIIVFACSLLLPIIGFALLIYLSIVEPGAFFGGEAFKP